MWTGKELSNKFPLKNKNQLQQRTISTEKCEVNPEYHIFPIRTSVNGKNNDKLTNIFFKTTGLVHKSLSMFTLLISVIQFTAEHLNLSCDSPVTSMLPSNHEFKFP